MTTSGEGRAQDALTASGIVFSITRHGRVGSLAEAAAARGVEPRDIVKTLVVRRGDGDFLFVLVPGDREISWPKLRAYRGHTVKSELNALRVTLLEQLQPALKRRGQGGIG